MMQDLKIQGVQYTFTKINIRQLINLISWLPLGLYIVIFWYFLHLLYTFPKSEPPFIQHL